MEFETWWLLLLPAFFSAGWFAARWDLRQTIKAAHQLPATYFKGLNHLLHDEQDLAVEALIDVVKQDPNTPELHFALGALFRRRGETDRAIRVHDNLLSRRDLSASHQQQARYELGLDYLNAGLLDQAEAALKPLEGTSLAVQAQEQRIIIAQSVRDWPLAIQLSKALNDSGKSSSVRHEVHYHCSLFDEALARNPPDVTSALDNLNNALQCDPNHPRVALCKAELARVNAQPAEYLQAVEGLGESHPDFASLVVVNYIKIATLIESSARALQHLARWWKVAPSQDLILGVLSNANKVGNSALATTESQALSAWAISAMQDKPSPLSLEARFDSMDKSELTEGDQSVLDQLRKINVKAGRYSCKACGFKARSFYWQCPGCHQWETYSPKTDAQAE